MYNNITLCGNLYCIVIFQIPSLGDMVNLMAAASESMFLPLGCEWNRNAQTSNDQLDKKYNVCLGGPGHVRAWNGGPPSPQASGSAPGTGSGSTSKTRIPANDETSELRR